MQFFRIFFAVLLVLSLNSCQQDMNKNHRSEPQKSKVPSTEFKNSKRPTPKSENQQPAKKPVQKELKKAKKKPLDTLKPVVALP